MEQWFALWWKLFCCHWHNAVSTARVLVAPVARVQLGNSRRSIYHCPANCLPVWAEQPKSDAEISGLVWIPLFTMAQQWLCPWKENPSQRSSENWLLKVLNINQMHCQRKITNFLGSDPCLRTQEELRLHLHPPENHGEHRAVQTLLSLRQWHRKYLASSSRVITSQLISQPDILTHQLESLPHAIMKQVSRLPSDLKLKYISTRRHQEERQNLWFHLPSMD